MDDYREKVEALTGMRRAKRTNAKVFCVACGASKRTLRKWHKSYLCEDCYGTAKRIGDDAFISALQGVDPTFEKLKQTDPILRHYFGGGEDNDSEVAEPISEMEDLEEIHT